MTGEQPGSIWLVERKFPESQNRGGTERVPRTLKGNLTASALVHAVGQAQALTAALELFAQDDGEDEANARKATYTVKVRA